MPKEIETDGVKETFYTTEEYTGKEGELSTLQTKIAELERINATRGEDFKAYSKMSEEEKKVYDANTTNLLKNEEKLRNELSELGEKLTAKEKRENESAKTNALTSIHHDDEASKKILEEKYALLTGMPETTAQEIAARAKEAAKLAGIQVDPRNPLYIPVSGDAPSYKPKGEYVDTPSGKTAADMVRAAMGLPTSDKK